MAGYGKPPVGRKFQKGDVPNPNGRPKKFICSIQNEGYKISQINDAIQVILSLNKEEIIELLKNKNATVLELTVASAIKKSIEKGNLDAIETLLSRVYGKPRQQIETKDLSENSAVKMIKITSSGGGIEIQASE